MGRGTDRRAAVSMPAEPAVRAAEPLPAWAWKNPPTPPVGCDTCGAVAGSRCVPKTGYGNNATTAKVHKARAVKVKAWYDRYDRSRENVVDLALERARRRSKPSITTPR
jgi:hypothetical protein